MEQLSNPEIEKYSRHIRLSEIGIKGQLKIKEASVLVIGAGGLGCPVLQYLCAAGVGKIGIVDNDWIELSNLPRQILYNSLDVDKPKPVVAKERLLQINTDADINTYFERLRKDNVFEIMQDYQIVVDCTDNFATRYLISDAAVLTNKPVVYGAANQFTGQVTVFNYHDGPTLRCLCPEPPHPLEVPSCSETGVLSSVTGVIGAMQATEVFKIILDREDVLSGKYIVFDSLNYSFEVHPIAKDANATAITELQNYDDACVDPDEMTKEINPDELKELQNKYRDLQIIDLREPGSMVKLESDHVSIPYYSIGDNLKLISSYNAIVFYCDYGILSARVISYLKNKYNMKNMYSLRM